MEEKKEEGKGRLQCRERTAKIKKKKGQEEKQNGIRKKRQYKEELQRKGEGN